MRYLLIFITSALLLLGCKENKQATAPEPARPSEVPLAEHTHAARMVDRVMAKPDTLSERSQSVYHALVAEMAIRRSQWDTALTRYLTLMESAAHPAVAERVTRLAVDSGQPALALDAASFWANHHLHDAEAQWIAATLFIKADREDEARPFLQHILTHNPDASEESFLQIASMMEGDEEQQDLIEQLAHVAAHAPDDFHALLTVAILTETWGDPNEALPLVNQILFEHPFEPRAVALRTKLLPPQQGLNYLRLLRKTQPNNKDIKLLYAQQLIDTNQVSLAKVYLYDLTFSSAHQYESLKSLALIAMQEYKLDKAQEYLHRLKAGENYRSLAQFYLGFVAEEKNDIAQAIDWYRRINPSEFYLRARIRAADLLATHDNIDVARAHLQESVALHKDDQKYYYLMEAQLLINDEQTDSAISILNQALQLAPNDPALLDSKGWAHFQLDDHDTALSYLQRAYAEQADPGIAAHLGEVLWTTGDLEGADAIWQEALQQDPQHPLLRQTMQRLSTQQ